MITAFVMAGIASLGILAVMGMAVLFSDQEGAHLDIIAGLTTLVMLLVAIFGLAFAMSAYRAKSNPLSVWLSLIWNILIVGGFLLLMLIGLFFGD